ncbi:hypothetical protein Bca101_093206 [Brassica carinata]
MIVKLMCPGSCKCSGVLFFFRIHVLLFVLLNSYVDPVYKDYGDKVARCIAWVHDQQCHQCGQSWRTEVAAANTEGS